MPQCHVPTLCSTTLRLAFLVLAHFALIAPAYAQQQKPGPIPRDQVSADMWKLLESVSGHAKEKTTTNTLSAYRQFLRQAENVVDDDAESARRFLDLCTKEFRGFEWYYLYNR